jgi:hypothetical protein
MDGFDISTVIGLTGVPIVTALVQVVKIAWPELDSRYWPVLCLAIAIGLNVGIAAAMGNPWRTGVIWGLLAGLSASGLYTWTRNRTAPPAS